MSLISLSLKLRSDWMLTHRPTHAEAKGRQRTMWLILALVLVVLWLGGFFVFHVAGFLIHLLLIFAVISLLIHLFTGRR
jgi:hypothetical protein